MHLLQSLRFPTLEQRHLDIPEAHCRTFRWIFDETTIRKHKWASFVQWLISGHGLYWIHGRAGSGKSTLMRYIFDHGHTRHFLRTWARGFDLELSGFFFWNGVTLEQRSQAGLLRSLLYQLLYKRPDLVREVYPNEWCQRSVTLAENVDALR